MRFMLCVVVFLSSFWLGCGAKPNPQALREPDGSVTQLKKDLEVIARFGTGESALEPIVHGMQALDPGFAKREELQSAFQKLGMAHNADERKAAAQEMITIIDSVVPTKT